MTESSGSSENGGGGDIPPMQMPDLVWRILSRRGYKSSEDIQNLFQPKLKNLSHPFCIDQMDVAIDRLILALKSDEKILIYGDYDLDGSPGVALLYDGLTRLGFKHIEYFQPSRLKDGYGMHAQRMVEFQALGVQLIVSVDVGITDVEAVQTANQLGIDVIITDHHLPKEKIPEALAILNPNKGFCNSNLKHLCGTGVAFYLILALKMELSRLNLLKIDFDPKELLDLFSLATITDMVPLIRENRILVKHGLLQLAKTKRPGLKKLFAELGFANKEITSMDVAFRIAPKLNALTRLDSGIRALDVLLADEKTADQIISQVLLVNQQRVEFQGQAKKIAQKLLRESSTVPFIWLHSHEFHPGVISLVANDLMKEHGIPVFIGAENEAGQIIGSARAPSADFNLQKILGAASTALSRWGGHQLAAGFEVSKANTDQFLELLTEYFATQADHAASDSEAHATPELFFDVEAKISEINSSFMKWYEGMGPFGNQFEAPLLMVKNARAIKVKKLKDSFVKYTLRTIDGEIEAPWFKGAVHFPEGSQVDTIVTPQWNEYNGQKSIQAVVQHMRPSKGSP